MLFCSSHRCHACGYRHYHLRTAAVAAAAVTLLVLAFFGGVGWMVWTHYEPLGPTVLPATSAPGPVQQAAPAAATQGAPAAPAGEPGLLAKAEGGDALAQYLLGVAYLNGQGGAKDLAMAARWFERAAQQGNADAQHALGMMYLSGRGALQNYETAFVWFEMAAMQNHAEAQYKLGTLYRNGEGVAVDKLQAYVWFNLAAAEGSERAAEARDSLMTALTPEQIARGQRESRAWRQANVKP